MESKNCTVQKDMKTDRKVMKTVTTSIQLYIYKFTSGDV